MKQQLLEYFEDTCWQQFGHELLNVNVSFPLPQQAFVKIFVKTVTPDITAFARILADEFVELDRHVDVLVAAG